MNPLRQTHPAPADHWRLTAAELELMPTRYELERAAQTRAAMTPERRAELDADWPKDWLV